jgi:Uma2 family endonuclease
MSARVREHATYEDLLRVPENMVAELIEGELFTAPRPRNAHANAASAVGYAIGPAYHFGGSRPGGWWILHEPELHLGLDVLVPDLAGWRRERVPQLPNPTDVPDWICEVLSPSTARLDRAKKLPIYARTGVQYSWIIDIDAQFLEVRRLESGAWREVAVFTGDTVRAEPFDAIEIDMSLVWGPPPA